MHPACAQAAELWFSVLALATWMVTWQLCSQAWENGAGQA